MVKKKEQKPGRFDALASAVKEAATVVDGLAPHEEALLTASKVQLPAPHLSPTQIEMYLRCPAQFKHRYIDGVKEPPAVAMVEGTSHHAAFEVNNTQKMKSGKDLSPKQLFEAFADSWATGKKSVEKWDEDDEPTVLGRAKGLQSAYLAKFGKSFQPTATERALAAPIGPVVLAGFIDAEGYPGTGSRKIGPMDRLSVVDYKVVGRAKSKAELESSLQLSAYSYLVAFNDGLDDFDVGYCSLVKQGLSIKWDSVPAEVERIRWLRWVVLHVVNQISLGNFPPTDPTSWACSQKFCGYWDRCRGAVQSGKLTVSAKKKGKK